MLEPERRSDPVAQAQEVLDLERVGDTVVLGLTVPELQRDGDDVVLRQREAVTESDEMPDAVATEGEGDDDALKVVLGHAETDAVTHSVSVAVAAADGAFDTLDDGHAWLNDGRCVPSME